MGLQMSLLNDISDIALIPEQKVPIPKKATPIPNIANIPCKPLLPKPFLLEHRSTGHLTISYQ